MQNDALKHRKCLTLPLPTSPLRIFKEIAPGHNTGHIAMRMCTLHKLKMQENICVHVTSLSG